MRTGVSHLSVESKSPFPQTVCSLWVVGFLIFFFSEGLANNQETISRLDIWQLAFVDLPILFNPFDISHAASTGIDSGWHLLPQRWPFFQIAAFVFMAAIAIGTVATRLLLQAAPLARCERFVIQAGLGLSVQSLWTLIVGWAGHLSFGTVMAPGISSTVFLAGGLFLRKAPAHKHVPERRHERWKRW